MSFTDTIHARLRPSPTLRIASALAHGAALLVVVDLAWFRPELALLAILVLISAIQSERGLTLRRRGVPVRLRWSADHRVRWSDRDGRERDGRCVEAKSWGAAWVRLKIRESNRRFAKVIVIPFDVVDADMHRRLRARCRVTPPERDV